MRPLGGAWNAADFAGRVIPGGGLRCLRGNGDETTPPSSPKPSASARPSPTVTAPSYLSGNAVDERKGYAAALADYREYRALEARFQRRATAPNAARHFYQKYTADWVTFWAVRKQWAEAGVRVVGRPEIVWNRPALIRLSGDGGGTVRIRMCLDATDVRVTQRGHDVAQNKTPTISTISMTRLSEDKRWRFLAAKAGKPC
ncbi:MAG: hypothetical protein JWO11_1959 [Nocardioides sp.]|nr:hypothetical protein [Nocardioides sp.]